MGRSSGYDGGGSLSTSGCEGSECGMNLADDSRRGLGQRSGNGVLTNGDGRRDGCVGRIVMRLDDGSNSLGSPGVDVQRRVGGVGNGSEVGDEGGNVIVRDADDGEHALLHHGGLVGQSEVDRVDGLLGDGVDDLDSDLQQGVVDD